jgi:ABC-type transport system involved in cytochrome c biogenesis ATPase subunit
VGRICPAGHERVNVACGLCHAIYGHSHFQSFVGNCMYLKHEKCGKELLTLAESLEYYEVI